MDVTGPASPLAGRSNGSCRRFLGSKDGLTGWQCGARHSEWETGSGPMSSGSGLQKTAIVAASDLDWRSQFRQTLPECGVEPLLFKTAVEAVECAHSVAARLVIIDVRQAVADGLYACRSIRGITNYVSVPIVLLIAAHDASTRTTGRQA